MTISSTVISGTRTSSRPCEVSKLFIFLEGERERDVHQASRARRQALLGPRLLAGGFKLEAFWGRQKTTAALYSVVIQRRLQSSPAAAAAAAGGGG